MSHRISLEGWVLIAICTLDAVLSAVLFATGLAVEANPMLQGFADAGTLPFLLAKLLTYLPAILAAEWYRRRRPEFVRRLMRGAILIYVGTYFSCVAVQFVVG